MSSSLGGSPRGPAGRSEPAGTPQEPTAPTAEPTAEETAALWETAQESPEFARLRKAVRSFIFPTTVAFLAWYLTYVLCTAYARPFMNTQVFGNINVGLIFGLLQFVSTFTIAVVYARYADRKMDPLADDLRAKIEGDAQ